MNEKIKELAMSVQCERHWREEDIYKFAELIVREKGHKVPDRAIDRLKREIEDDRMEPN